MGTSSDQATAIANILDGITNSGVVYDHQPAPRGNDYAKFVQKFVTVVETKRQIRAWTVSYVGEQREQTTVALGATKTLRRINWLVRFIQSWDDTSEVDFRNLTEAAVTALDANLSLGGTALTHTPCMVTTPNEGQGVMVGDYGCHLAQIRFSALVEESLSTQ